MRGMRDTTAAKLPARFTVLYAWVFMVGLGSLLFHATLKWSMQLLDEIPMIYMASHILHCLLYPNDKDFKSAPWWRKSCLPAYGVSVAVSLAYAACQNPIFHQVCFGGLLLGCVLAYPSFAASSTRGLADAKAVKHKAFGLFLRAAMLMLTAFGIWNIDNVACAHLRTIREFLESRHLMFWMSPCLQFHAIWHMLTTAAADYMVVGVVYMWCQGQRSRRAASTSGSLEIEIQNKIFGAFPQILITRSKARRK